MIKNTSFSMKPQINKLMTGLAGEYLVAGMMNLKGWIASLTLKNFPGVDIFGLNPDTGENVEIQVKSCWNNNLWIGIRHSERPLMEERIKGPFVFVHMEDTDTVSYFILTKKELINLIDTTDDAYFNKPRVRQIKPDYPMAISLKDLLPFKNHWDSLWSEQ